MSEALTATPAEKWRAIEDAVRAREPGAVWVDPRVLRRVIKRHRQLRLGLHVPHSRCYPIPLETLARLVSEDEIGRQTASLPRDIVLLPRPPLDDVATANDGHVLHDIWRLVFHARVHRAFWERERAGEFTEAACRARVHRIGQTEFDEVRLVLRHDEHLWPRASLRDTYVEFAALYLELRRFEPGLVRDFFSGIEDMADNIETTLALDITAHELLVATRPKGAPLERAFSKPRASGTAVVNSHREATPLGGEIGDKTRPVPFADATIERGNAVRAALVAMRAGGSAAVPLRALSERLAAALHGGDALEWATVLDTLARAAAARPRHGFIRSVAARVLYDIQKACTEFEREIHAVDLVRWALSLGRTKVVRPLPAAREVRIARHLRAANEKMPRVVLDEPDHHRVTARLRAAVERADDNLRAALRPRLDGALDAVGIRPTNVPEDVARRKLVEELLDGVIARGFINLGHLRDAISRNDLKLPRLTGPREFFCGDPLLRCDKLLANALDGVFHRGEIYLRGLQKLSSLGFGTATGRLATLWIVLPLVTAFVALEGLQHIVGPLLHATAGIEIEILNGFSFAAVALLVVGLVQSGVVRKWTVAVLRGIGRSFRAVFVRAPAWVLSLPPVRRFLESRAARAIGRYALKPLFPALMTLPFLLVAGVASDLVVVVLAAIVVVFDVLLVSPVGAVAEEVATDAIGRAWRGVRHQIIPGAVRALLELFKLLLDLFERLLYTVDEWLRFRRGANPAWIPVRAVLGLLWFFVTYLVRIYVNLLVEPQVNPIKHFPVVTVSHKIILPMSPTLIEAVRAPLIPFGATFANGFAGATVLLLPGVFGFLVWELKENWRLYAAKRRLACRPVIVGHHGETVARLLRPGFHSGTVPRLYAKVRRAASRHDHAALAKHEETAHHVAETIRLFVERELCALLNSAPGWKAGRIQAGDVELRSNSIRAALSAPSASNSEARVRFEEQSGWILGSLEERGFVAALDDAGRGLFDAALIGLYRKANVQFVREQLEGAISAFSPEPGAAVPYDISDEGLVVWPGGTFKTEVVYALPSGDSSWRGEPPAVRPPRIDDETLAFGTAAVRWDDWVRRWSEGGQGPE